ncbi:MAG: DedA family protein [Proteobacteria bacterium]|nr:MAG: DedA family protein [Pseudomonadota bacterium]
MDSLRQLLDIVRHLDKHLQDLTQAYGVWTYAILGAIVFCETGLIVLPFLPGDSLLFAAGAVTSLPESGIGTLPLGALLIVCAIVGDTLNYHVGKALGPRVLRSRTSKIFNVKHLERTKSFFEKYGGKTIVLARFVPIVRTFAPFVAGAGAMTYSRFILFNIGGAIAWVVLMMGAGVFFGRMPVVQKNFELVVIGIVFLSVLPMVIEFIRAKREGQKPEALPEAP